MYIGQTCRELKERIKEHLSDSRIKTEPCYNYPFYRAIRKYGETNLIWEVIDNASSHEELDQKEIYWIQYYNTYLGNKNCNGYNQNMGGSGQCNLVQTEETKQKIRDSISGEKHPNAKLTKDIVLKILALSKQKQYSQVELSKMFNTSEGTISRILSGLRWGSVTGIKYDPDNSFYIYK